MNKIEYARLRLKLLRNDVRRVLCGKIRRLRGVRRKRVEQLEFRF